MPSFKRLVKIYYKFDDVKMGKCGSSFSKELVGIDKGNSNETLIFDKVFYAK